jgi:hypothetical protein
LPPLLTRLPADCQELMRSARDLPAQSGFTPRTSERRRGALALVKD